MRYDQQNALIQLARRCNAECKQVTAGHQPKEFTELTAPIFRRYAAQAVNIGSSLHHLKYHIAILNGVIVRK